MAWDRKLSSPHIASQPFVTEMALPPRPPSVIVENHNSTCPMPRDQRTTVWLHELFALFYCWQGCQRVRSSADLLSCFLPLPLLDGLGHRH